MSESRAGVSAGNGPGAGQSPGGPGHGDLDLVPSREPKSIIRGSSAQRSRSWDARGIAASLSASAEPGAASSTNTGGGGSSTGSRVTFDATSTANAQDREHSDSRPSAGKRHPRRSSSIARERGSASLSLAPSLADSTDGELEFIGVADGVGAGDVLELHSAIRHRTTRLVVGCGGGAGMGSALNGAGGRRLGVDEPLELPFLAGPESPSISAAERDEMLSATVAASASGGAGESNLERLARSLAALPASAGSLNSQATTNSTSMHEYSIV